MKGEFHVSKDVHFNGIAFTYLSLTGPLNALGNQPAIDSMVTVETNLQEYHQNEEIVVTITNNLDKSITTIDQQAFCTIVSIKQLIGKEWKELKNCFSGIPVSNVTLGSYSETIVKLPALSPGTYQAYIRYSLGLKYYPGKSYISLSSQFLVQ